MQEMTAQARSRDLAIGPAAPGHAGVTSLEATSGEAMQDECVNPRKAGARSRVARILLLLAFAAALAGCEPVQSLYPFFDPKDVVLDSDLEGAWVTKRGETEDTNIKKLRFERGQDKTDGYEVEAIFYGDEPRENEPDEMTITFSVHPFQVADSRFADFYISRYSEKWGSRTAEFDVKDWPFWVRTHTVYRVKGDNRLLQLAWLDDERVKEFTERNHLRLGINENDFFVLTGNTEELKASLLLQAEKEDLLGTDMEFIREE